MEPIAIVGVGCRFPGADGPAEFRELLRAGRDAVSEVPASRWSIDRFYDPNPAAKGKTNSRWGGFLDRIDGFDAGFFQIASAEAEKMDPQQRLLLEVSWEALEDAGLIPETLEGSRTGVFTGIMYFEYGHLQMAHPETIDSFMGTGVCLAVAANRISYFFDFTGPSMAIDTACSSSAVAVHTACESLRHGECDLALAGGVSLMLTPSPHIFFAKAGILSPDGRTHTLDARAQGIVRGEGAGIVVLKRHCEAVRDGDPIYALILGSAVNQDGRSNGLMAPNGPAQEALLREAYRRASVSPGSVQYVELHGTGTHLGDPIEARALGNVLREGRPEGGTCAVGSVKTNIGHLEAAAGIAGIIKTALMLDGREIAQSLHYETPNPHISLERLPIRLQQKLVPWPAADTPQLAGVSSFGFGGTNVHLVMSAPALSRRDHVGDDRPCHILPLSARTASSLAALAASYAQVLQRSQDLHLADICYTAAVGRSHHAHRRAVVGESREEIIAALAGPMRKSRHQRNASTDRRWSDRPRAVFVFGGQGAHSFNMGRSLFEREPVFRGTIESCHEAFADICEINLITELTAAESRSRLDRTDVAQPVVFAVECALGALWRAWGIEPAAVIGHSLGEIAAAYTIGALTISDAARIVQARSRLMQQASGRGRMAAVNLGPDEAFKVVAPYSEQVAVAAINAADSVVLSGEPDRLAAILKLLSGRGIAHRMLPVEFAFHSPQMAAYEEELRQALWGIHPRPSVVPLFSTVSGGQVDTEKLGAVHWTEQLAQPVRFADALAGLLGLGPDAIIELGPHPTLARFIRSGLDSSGRQAAVLASLERTRNASRVMLESLAALYELGFDPDWRAVSSPGARVHGLPHYAWDRSRYWLDLPHESREEPAADHPLLGREIEDAREGIIWESQLDASASDYMMAHRIQNAVVMPGAAFVEMGIAAAVRRLGRRPLEIADIRLRKALFLEPVREIPLRLVLEMVNGARDEAGFRIASRQESAWETHVEARVRTIDSVGVREPLEEVRRRCPQELDVERHYAGLRRRGFDYGPPFQAVRTLFQGEGEAVAWVSLRPDLVTDGCELHPVLLDTSMQVLFAALPADAWEETGGGAFMPDTAQCVRVCPPVTGPLWCHAALTAVAADSLRGDAWFFDESGNVVVEVVGLHARRLDRISSTRTVTDRAADLDRWLYEMEWIEDVGSPAAALSVIDGSRWALVTEDAAVARCLASGLQSMGADAMVALPGELRVIEDGRWDGIIYLPANASREAEPAVRAEKLCAEALELIQAFQRAGTRPARLCLATRGGQAVRGDGPESLDIAASTLWGLAAAAEEEFPHTSHSLIDLPFSAKPEEFAAWILDAIAGHAGEPRSAYRSGKRLVPRLMRSSSAVSRKRAEWRCDGTYLITGGFGGLGLALAEWLVDQGVRRLVLMGRSALPPRRQWAEIPAGSLGAEQIAKVQGLERKGASIQMCAVDVADEEALTAFWNEFRAEQWPPVRGVFHGAGIPGPGMLTSLNAEQLEAVLRPKVKGAWLLHSLMRDEALDHFVLFSSTAAVLGSHAEGLAAYAAANRFLDALAHYRRSLKLPAISINWGPWGDVGMARGMRAAFTNRGIETMPAATALEVLGRVLERNPEQIAVMPIDWARWRQLNPRAASDPFLDRCKHEKHDEGRIASAPKGVRRWMTGIAKPDGPQAVESFLIDRFSKYVRLNGEALDPNRPLSAYGLDSLAAVEVKNGVERELGVVLPIVEFLKGPSVRQLAAIIAEQMEPNRATAITTRGRANSLAHDPDLIERLEELPIGEIDELLAELLSEQESEG